MKKLHALVAAVFRFRFLGALPRPRLLNPQMPPVATADAPAPQAKATPRQAKKAGKRRRRGDVIRRSD